MKIKTIIFFLNARKGAVVVEYVLLLVACVGFAYTIYSLVDMDAQNPGWVINLWKKILIPIAEDIEK